MNTAVASWLERLDVAEVRLRALAPRRSPAGALTEPDPPTGERWEAGQVWAHLAEFIPYWLGEAARVLEGARGEVVPFGRTKSDPERLAAIERDRRTDPVALWGSVEDDIQSLRTFLAALDERSVRIRGLHPTLGEMDVAQLVDEFLVGHLEEHAEQLAKLQQSSD